jgi:ribosomal protein S18 acetylase RimI-like enzyme
MICTLRTAVKIDEEFLWQMLYYASHMDEEGAPVESARTNPDLAGYVEHWGEREGDRGFVAVGEDGRRLGAAWLRVMPAGSPLYHVVARETPELAIAVATTALGTGVGTLLLRQLIEAARGSHRTIALSVRANNPAARLYERIGFATVASIVNRVGTVSHVMKLDLS